MADEVNKLPAPALARGIRILEALNEATGPLNLEELAQRLGYPKASLLRLLETLSAINLVRRDEAGKTYVALAGLVHHDRRSFVRRIVRKEMERLTLGTDITSEWYEAGPSYMRLADLLDPPDAHVRITARVGFRRMVDGELEAVTRIALASPLFEYAGAPLWQYTEEGEKVKLSADECVRQIVAAQETGITMDPNWNGNGIRRYAALLLDGERVAGILSLAETFTPSADKRIDANLEQLKQSVEGIAAKIQ